MGNCTTADGMEEPLVPVQCPTTHLPGWLAVAPVSLVVKQKWSLSGNDFCVKDSAGNDVLKVEGKAFSFKNTATLTDMTGAPLVRIDEKLCTLHSTYDITDSQGNAIMEVKEDVWNNMLTLMTPDGQVAYTIKLALFSNDFAIRNAQGQVCARVHGGSFSDTYAVTLPAGADILGTVAIIAIYDALEEQTRRQRNRNWPAGRR